MLDLVINDHAYPVPTSWQEVTLGQWIAMAEQAGGLDHIGLLAVFTGLPIELLANLPCDAVKLELVPELAFISEPLDLFSLPRPDRIRLAGQDLEPIDDPGRERFGQRLYMQQLVGAAMASEADHWTLVAPTIACYYAPALHPDGKWDDRHVKLVQAQVLDMPVVEAYPEATFFLTGYVEYRRPKPHN